MHKVNTLLLTLANESHYSDDFTSLMHHFNTPRTRMCSPDQCSISCLFTPPFCKPAFWVVATNGAVCYNGHTKFATNRTTYLYDYEVTCMSVLHLHSYIQSDFDQNNITQRCMKGEADNSRFVSMHIYMHLPFKEVKIMCKHFPVYVYETISTKMSYRYNV